MVLPTIGIETHLVEWNVIQFTLQTRQRIRLSFSHQFDNKMYIAEQHKWLDRDVLHGKIATVLGVFYRYRYISSKTSSFGGTSAQPSWVALFFGLFVLQRSILTKLLIACASFDQSKPAGVVATTTTCIRIPQSRVVLCRHRSTCPNFEREGDWCLIYLRCSKFMQLVPGIFVVAPASSARRNS